jgi:aldehyde dehydrogenase (NAD+)
MKGISLLEYYAGEGFRMHGKTLPSESRDTFTYTIRQPLGVVGLIAPWNFPWAIPVWKSAPAIVSGNCVVFKPAELTPATSVLLAEIYEEAGTPSRRVQHAGGLGLTGRRSHGSAPSCAPSRSPARTRSAARSTSRRPSAAPR